MPIDFVVNQTFSVLTFYQNFHNIEEAFDMPPSVWKAPVAVKLQLRGGHLFFVHLMDCCRIRFYMAGWGSTPPFYLD